MIREIRDLFHILGPLGHRPGLEQATRGVLARAHVLGWVDATDPVLIPLLRPEHPRHLWLMGPRMLSTVLIWTQGRYILDSIAVLGTLALFPASPANRSGHRMQLGTVHIEGVPPVQQLVALIDADHGRWKPFLLAGFAAFVHVFKLTVPCNS